MKSNELFFSVKAGIKNIVGKDLIADDNIAIFELVKNSYDAYASKVIITFEDNKIIIADDGKGMSIDDIEKKWLALAYSAKKNGDEDNGIDQIFLERRKSYRDIIQEKRKYAGAKGIGRFSCDRLGEELLLSTKKINTNTIEQLEIDWKDFEESNKRIFEKYLTDSKVLSDKVLRVKLYSSLLLDDIKYFAYYAAFLDGDYKQLNNALWQTGRTELLRGGLLASGTIYTDGILKGLFTSFACNVFSVIPSFIPKDLPLLKGTYYPENVINILYSLYYQDEERLSESLLRAQQFLGKKKRTGMEEFSVRYFINLARKDAVALSESLQSLCQAYQRRGFPYEKIDKCFADEIHGLYRLVRFFDHSLFEEVSMPSHKTFLKEFEEWQVRNQFPKGQQFYIYPQDMADANRILTKGLPRIYLAKSGRDLVIDVDQFAVDLSRLI